MKKLFFPLLLLLLLAGCAGQEDTIAFHDTILSRADLSAETVEWLEKYNALSEEEQLAVSAIPADLHALLGYGGAECREADDDVRPGAVPFILEIVDRTVTEGIATDSAMEKFFEDEERDYFFPSIKSRYVLVTYNNGNSEPITAALEGGRAVIADLDRFGIAYHAEEKNA